MIQQPKTIPVTVEEIASLNWKDLDVIIVSGDAFIDHPAFGSAIIARTLISAGYKTAVISQPQTDEDFLKLGTPKLFFGITSGNMDSMVNHYTALGKLRHDDAYTPNGQFGIRPNRATSVYANTIKRLFKGTPVVLGGIEASLRRLPHYDYWSDSVKNSIICDTKADAVVYGMAEKTIVKLANAFSEKQPKEQWSRLSGLVSIVSEPPASSVMLPTYSEIKHDKNLFLDFYKIFFENYQTKTIVIKHNEKFLQHNLPAEKLSQAELDKIYALPFSRKPHPIYKGKKIPAYEQIKWSVTSHRGCFGGCAFCALNIHQGKHIQSRSHDSIISEFKKIALDPEFKGTISDVGGPSANMYGITCNTSDKCLRTSCLWPEKCSKLPNELSESKKLLEACRKVSNIKNIFVASGIRHDMCISDPDYVETIIKYHTSGYFKVAPEHICDSTLYTMQKAPHKTFLEFLKIFKQKAKQLNVNYYVIPYLLVGHPNSKIEDAVELALFLKKNGMIVEQVQEFTPTPMTISTCMYYTSKDFHSSQDIYIPKGRDIKLQKAVVMYHVNENRKYIIEALRITSLMHLTKIFFD